MRSSSTGPYRSLTVTLIIALVVAFLVQLFVQRFYPQYPIEDWFALSLAGIQKLRLWQLLTFQFMHGGFLHILFNCLALYMFGRSVEETLGRAKFLTLYFASGFIGGAFQLLLSWVFPQYFGGPVVGASAGIMGLIAAYTTLFPMRDLTLFIYFFPVTLRAQYFFWLALAYAIFGMVFRFDNTAHAAHLGGLLMGVAYIKWSNNPEWQATSWRPFQARQRKRELVKAASVRVKQLARPRPDTGTDLPSEEFISKEVDPILDKISAHGIQSLTDRERQILQAARAKMSKR
jgi:membrane associated rhomboid family serine protease